MFTCNNLSLLTFTYYLKCILALNMTIIPFIYFFTIYILIIRDKQKKIIITKKYLKKYSKSTFYFILFLLVSIVTHNMLNNKNNICYTKATKDIYHEYKNSYLFLENKDIDSNLKTKYLENILSKKIDKKLESLIYNEEVKTVAKGKQEEIVSNYLHENDLNKQNNVYVMDGVFYYPKYINGNYNTYSGTNCPNNPTNEGYNNKYGYNNYFFNRLTYFINEAEKNGYKITMSTQGCRTYDKQQYYYKTMTKGRAAFPGISLHGYGIASDLEFYQSDGSICSGYRTESNCPSMGWAHQNAERFGLTFPLLNASYKEDWHIEPINKSKY